MIEQCTVWLKGVYTAHGKMSLIFYKKQFLLFKKQCILIIKVKKVKINNGWSAPQYSPYYVKMMKMCNFKDLHMTAPSLACQEVSFPMHICNQNNKNQLHDRAPKKCCLVILDKERQASNFSFSLAPWARAQASCLGKQHLRAACPKGKPDFKFYSSPACTI